MKLNEFVEKYNLLQDEEGRYYKFDKKGNRVEPYATIEKISKIIGLSSLTIKKYVKWTGVLPRKHKTGRKHAQDAYNLNAIMDLCSYLLKNFHFVNDKGIAIINGESYSSIAVLRRILDLSQCSIVKRIKKSDIKPLKIKLRGGQIVNGYSINEVRKLCADLLQELPSAKKNGIAIINGQEFTTAYNLTKLLKLSHNAINLRIKKAGLKTQIIKTKDGGIRHAYNIISVKSACSDLLIYSANSSNIVILEGHKYTSLENLIRLLKISGLAIKKRIKIKRIQSRKIKIKGKILDGYKITEVRKSCADLLKKVLRADKDGIARINGQELTTIENLARLFKISTPTITARIKKNKLKPVKIKHPHAGVFNAYNISDVAKLCSELTESIFVTDKYGFAEINGKKFASTNAIAKSLGINYNIVKQRVGKLASISVKTGNGLRKAYNFDDVKTACSDQLQDYPITDNNHIVILGGQQFSTMSRIYSTHNLSQAINYREVAAELKPIKIKNKTGHIVDGFNVNEAVKIHSRLLSQKIKSKLILKPVSK